MQTYRSVGDNYTEQFELTKKEFEKLSHNLNKIGVYNEIHCVKIVYWDGPQDEEYYVFKMIFISWFRKFFSKPENHLIQQASFSKKGKAFIYYEFNNFLMTEDSYIYKNQRLRQALREENNDLESKYYKKDPFYTRRSINIRSSRPEGGPNRNRASHFLQFNPVTGNPFMECLPIPDKLPPVFQNKVKRPPPPLGGKLKAFTM